MKHSNIRLAILRIQVWQILGLALWNPALAVHAADALENKATLLEQDLHESHWLDGLYVSIVPAVPDGIQLEHTVADGGNVIHAGVWTGRYLAGVGYQYAVTQDPAVRERGGTILKALRILQEVTGRPGLLARGYVKGHGPVAGWESDGADSIEWHQGQGEFADYRWYGDVSVDNFNAVLYGCAVYFDLAADDLQKEFISRDVDLLMTHLLDHHCRIVDVDGETTRWGHVGIDPDPDRTEYYNDYYRRQFRFADINAEKAPLRASLMLLPDLLIAHHITGNDRYREFYKRVVDRYKDNPEPEYYKRPFSPENLARTNHSSEGQAYEALYNLIRYEHDPEQLAIYRPWVEQLWESNWMEGNSLFTYMTLALLPHYRTSAERQTGGHSDNVPHAAEALRLATDTLERYPKDRVLRPVMNSIRDDIERNPAADRFGSPQAARPIPIDERPLDNEYAWKGNPYQLDGWLKPTVTAFQVSCDDPQVAWFCDSSGRIYRTLDGGAAWEDMTTGLMGAQVLNIAASDDRTFVVWAKTNRGVHVTRDGGLSWRENSGDDAPEFAQPEPSKWLKLPSGDTLRIDESSRVVRAASDGKVVPAMDGWRIPLAKSLFETSWGVIASGPGGVYRTIDGQRWNELRLWQEQETGAADFLHAYWMGRYYGFIPETDTAP